MEIEKNLNVFRLLRFSLFSPLLALVVVERLDVPIVVAEERAPGPDAWLAAV